VFLAVGRVGSTSENIRQNGFYCYLSLNIFYLIVLWVEEHNKKHLLAGIYLKCVQKIFLINLRFVGWQ